MISMSNTIHIITKFNMLSFQYNLLKIEVLVVQRRC